jgi:outer membrane protein OmpA-like peptidoglycan-associated protein
MYEYGDGGEGDRPLARTVAVVVAVVALALVAWFVVRPRFGGDDGESTEPLFGDVLTTTTATQPTDVTDTDVSDDIATTDTATTEISTTDISNPGAGTNTVTSDPPLASETPATAASVTVAATPGEATYETLPDGSPAPVVALYDVSKITLTGAVPDQAAKDRLQVLAIGNAKPGQDTVENFLTINPSVPRHIGVRVVELTSVRFPEGSAEVLPPHALELDRVVSIMNALPNVTALVIGHADQRGSELTNYEISEERADAVVDYIAGHGIEPSRLSSRAVGETDLLTLNNEPAALELNRRTEFVFYGLLQE